MSLSTSTSRALHQTLGDEAADEVVNWMHQMESSRSEFREMLDSRFARHTAELSSQIARLEVKIEQRYGGLMKWSFVYWVGAVVVIAALARMIR